MTQRGRSPATSPRQVHLQPILTQLQATEEQKLAARSGGKRIFALDAARGLAACTVVLFHLRSALYTDEPPWYLAFFFAGHQAVVLFFVLSGFVLGLPFWRGRQMPYGKYLVRRLFRIYVPYLAAVLLAAAVASRMLNSTPPLTPWFYRMWHTPITARLIGAQALMSIQPDINVAFWSLRYEVVMSIVFPLVGMLLLRLRTGMSLLVALALLLAGTLSTKGMLLWASCFMLGALLGKERELLSRLYARGPAWAHGLLAVVSFALYTLALPPVSSPVVPVLGAAGLIAGACGLLVLAQYSRAARWLDTAVPEYLGRISFSLYLTHMVVLYPLLILLYGRIPLAALTALYLLGALLLAHLFCIAVEEPAMRLGRRLTS